PVAGVGPAVGVEDLLAFALVETQHEAVAADQDFSFLAGGKIGARRRVDNPVLGAGDLVTEGAPVRLRRAGDLLLGGPEGVRAAGLRHTQRRDDQAGVGRPGV